jgi:hypothetical protein
MEQGRAEREWWRRLPRVVTAPREVFAALVEPDEDDVLARQEPVLLIVLLAGMAGVVMSPTWGTLMDDSERDALIVAVLTFIAGGIYGAVSYYLVGGALHLGARGMGSAGRYRLARHVLAFACVPLALSLLVVLPLQLAVFGGDVFRSGGSDDGVLGGAAVALELAFVAWTIVLLLLGVRTVYRFTWARTAGTLALLVLFLAAFVALPTAL